MKLNFTNVKKAAEVIPPGMYEAAVKKVTAKVSSTGKPMWLFQFNIINNSQYNDTPLFLNHTLEEQCLWSLFNTLVALGEDEADLKENGIDPDELEKEVDGEKVVPKYVGIEVKLQVAQELYQGDPVNKIKKVKPLTSNGTIQRKQPEI